jgi:predicted kinase
MEKTLYIVRGIPGSGKSTFAKSLGGVHFETDMYFMKNGEYNFDISQIKVAHEWCRESVEYEMAKYTPKVVVSNTFTQEWEMKPYFDLAEKYGYKVFSVIVENRHGGRNLHGVPDETLSKMKGRFEISL